MEMQAYMKVTVQEQTPEYMKDLIQDMELLDGRLCFQWFIGNRTKSHRRLKRLAPFGGGGASIATAPQMQCSV